MNVLVDGETVVTFHAHQHRSFHLFNLNVLFFFQRACCNHFHLVDLYALLIDERLPHTKICLLKCIWDIVKHPEGLKLDNMRGFTFVLFGSLKTVFAN